MMGHMRFFTTPFLIALKILLEQLTLETLSGSRRTASLDGDAKVYGNQVNQVTISTIVPRLMDLFQMALNFWHLQMMMERLRCSDIHQWLKIQSSYL